MDSKPSQSIALWGVLALALLGILIMFVAGRHDGRLESAFIDYHKGEDAGNIAEREKAFNESLKIYKQVADDYHVENGNGYLEYNIANNYFQLGDYPWAILYYYKALKLDPSNDKAKQNLQIALSKVDQKQQVSLSPWQQFVTLGPWWSLGQRFQNFFFLGLAAILLGALYILKGIPSLRMCAFIMGALAAIFLVSILLTWFTSYPQAVVLRSTMLYRDAGKQYAKVQDTPIAAGSKVDILDTVADGQWVMVTVDGSIIGYIPIDKIGMI